MTPSDREREGRLHPATLLFRVLAHARSLLLPALVVIFFARGEAWQKWLGLLFVPLVLWDAFQYFTLRWRFEAEELVLREGWLFRNVRHVPYARVQNVDLKQGPLHRLLRVAEVRIETAGGGAEEASLRVIGLDQYEELRARIFAGRAAPGAAAEASGSDPQPLLALGARDLLLLALNPARGLALVAVAYGVAWEFNLLDRIDLGDRIEAFFADATLSAAALQAVLGLFAIAAAVFLLSLAATFLALWGFRLEQIGDHFRIRRGLLTRQVATIPRRRIQIVTVRQNPLQRAIGRVRVLVGTAGGEAGEEDARSDSGAQFAPLLRASELRGLLLRIRPELDPDAVAWLPPAPAAPRRILAKHLALALTIAAGLTLWLDWKGALLGLAVLAGAVVRARRVARTLAWGATDWGIAGRGGAFSTSTSFTFFDRVQTVAVTASPFDRRHGHATLKVDTAGGNKTGHPLHLFYLTRSEAEGLRESLVRRTAGTRFRW